MLLIKGALLLKCFEKERSKKPNPPQKEKKSKKHIKNTNLCFHLRQQLPSHYFNVTHSII